MEMCACGKELHYTDQRIKDQVQQQIWRLGDMVSVDCPDENGHYYSYQVPRHYIALHGIKGGDLPKLAEQGIITRKRVYL